MAQFIRRSLVVFLAMLVFALAPAWVNANSAAGVSHDAATASMSSTHMHGPSAAMSVSRGDDCCAKPRSRSCGDCLILRSCETACAAPAVLADAPIATLTVGPGSDKIDADILFTGIMVKPPTEPPKV